MSTTAKRKQFSAESRRGGVFARWQAARGEADGDDISNSQLLTELRQVHLRLDALEMRTHALTGPKESAGTAEAAGAKGGEIAATKRALARLMAPPARTLSVAEAAVQLSEIVQATEDATFVILDTVERVGEMVGELKDHCRDSVAIAAAERIESCFESLYEACNFQDITGQRVSKVTGALKHVEHTVTELVDLWGADTVADEPAAEDVAEEVTDAALLNGPQLAGEAISQDDIDKLFD